MTALMSQSPRQLVLFGARPIAYLECRPAEFSEGNALSLSTRITDVS
jgi:hypothetical protein